MLCSRANFFVIEIRVNITVAICLLLISLLLLSKPLVSRCFHWLLSLASWKPIGIGCVVIALCLLVWSIGASGWYYYSARLAIFLVGLTTLLKGIYILTVNLTPLQNLMRWVIRHYFRITVPLSFLCLLASLFILTRSYIGPVPDISGCESTDQLAVSCVVSNPEDMVITPDKRFLLVSEFGGITPLEPVSSGQLALVDVTSKASVPLAIIYSDNTWGDGQCSKTAASPFGPHGIDLIERDDGRHQLAVVNHMGAESIEMFELVAVDAVSEGQPEAPPKWGLIWRGCVLAPQANFLNDVTLLSDGSFFVSHMYDPEFSEADFIYQQIAKQDTGYVMYWSESTGFGQVPATDGAMPNGLVFDRENDILYVAYNIGDKVSAIDIINKTVTHSISIDGPDNLVLEEGTLWVTSLDHQLLDGLVCHNLSPCALPFSVLALDASNLELMERWAFTQQPFGLPTVALPLKSETLNQVFIGTFNGDRLAYFDRGANSIPTDNKVFTQDAAVDVVPSVDAFSK